MTVNLSILHLPVCVLKVCPAWIYNFANLRNCLNWLFELKEMLLLKFSSAEAILSITKKCTHGKTLWVFWSVHFDKNTWQTINPLSKTNINSNSNSSSNSNFWENFEFFCVGPTKTQTTHPFSTTQFSLSFSFSETNNSSSSSFKWLNLMKLHQITANTAQHFSNRLMFQTTNQIFYLPTDSVSFKTS